MPGRWHPVPLCRGQRGAGHLPAGLEAAEVVDAQHRETLALQRDTAPPPRVTIGCHRSPVVMRIAPALAIGAEIVRRHTGLHREFAVVRDAEKVSRGPHIRAVAGHENRHIAEEFDAEPACIGLQVLPLQLEHVLPEAERVHPRGMERTCGRERIGITVTQRLRPAVPGLITVRFAQRDEQRIVLEPVRMTAAERGEAMV